jgi:hypothetical protein
MRAVVRNSVARQTIQAERVRVIPAGSETCTWCGNVRERRHSGDRQWLYRFHVDDDSGSRHSGPIADGRLFCSRDCAESYTGQPFDEMR